ncbi:hypothetical protein H6F67_08615 [Microcoleus sp. FACHB-1515]|uniref:hypothetical protein n=1 Tax=Cyanophyceae TaxID=3028117 RepID=UPI0016830DFE|nr:hypothetical protein [Microcoleus sp. FACHB-1515]MBD2089916.1 hypothetical protein [Microcoleus sp. FACHB-1515]
MSNTTAFLSGCAITGVAAVLLLGGGFAVGQYRNNVPPGALPTPTQTLPGVPETATPIPVPPYPTNLTETNSDPQLTRDLEQQRTETAALKSQVEDLKRQVEQQRNDMQRLTAQIQVQQETLNTIAARSDRGDALSGSGQSQTLLMGAVGFGFLVVLGGGGAVLIGVIVLLVQSQRRSNRTMHVIHPVQPTYSFSDQDLLPSQMRPRRARQINYYED